jgi:hypothetical protein
VETHSSLWLFKPTDAVVVRERFWREIAVDIAGDKSLTKVYLSRKNWRPLSRKL